MMESPQCSGNVLAMFCWRAPIWNPVKHHHLCWLNDTIFAGKIIMVSWNHPGPQGACLVQAESFNASGLTLDVEHAAIGAQRWCVPAFRFKQKMCAYIYIHIYNFGYIKQGNTWTSQVDKNEWMNEWMKWMNEWMHELKWNEMTWNEWMNEWMKWMNEWMNAWIEMKWNEMTWNEWMNEWNEMKWHEMTWNEWMNEMNEWMNAWIEMKWNDMKWMNEYTSKCIDECANKSVNTNIIFSSLARRWVPCLQQHGRGSSEREQLLLRSARYFLTSKSPDLKKQWGPGWVVRSQHFESLWPWDLPMFHKELLTEPPVRQGLCEAMVSPLPG